MATEIDICNLALSYLGDDATVSSIDPPEGSAQADHCAKFYSVARNSLLEMHPWGFATKRKALALLGSAWPEWQYAYAAPSDAVNFLAILPADANNDYSTGQTIPNGMATGAGMGYTPQPYSVETDDDGAAIIYTNQADAVLRYTGLVVDPTKFSPLFTEALGWLLASKLAGPVLKGEVGRDTAKSCYAMFRTVMGQATTSDANQRRINPQIVTPWINGR